MGTVNVISAINYLSFLCLRAFQIFAAFIELLHAVAAMMHCSKVTIE